MWYMLNTQHKMFLFTQKLFQLTFWKISGGSRLNVILGFLFAIFFFFRISFYSPYTKGHLSSSRIGRTQCQWAVVVVVKKVSLHPSMVPKMVSKVPQEQLQSKWNFYMNSRATETSLYAENYLDQTHILLIWAIKEKNPLFSCVFCATHTHNKKKVLKATNKTHLATPWGKRSGYYWQVCKDTS